MTHISPSICCMTKLTIEIETQQQKPRKRGFPPVLTSSTIFVFSPMAAIAIMMKNFERVFIGLKKDASKPNTDVMIVVITEQRMK